MVTESNFKSISEKFKEDNFCVYAIDSYQKIDSTNATTASTPNNYGYLFQFISLFEKTKKTMIGKL
jgi:hypothetical protein